MSKLKTPEENQTSGVGDADGRARKQTARPAKPALPPSGITSDAAARTSSSGADKRRLRLTQVRSGIGQNPRNRGTLRALGLGRIGKTAEHDDTPVIAGMLRKVRHLVRVESSNSSKNA